MDDDGSNTLNYEEFKKGLQDIGVSVTDVVSNYLFLSHIDVFSSLCEPVGNQGGFQSF